MAIDKYTYQDLLSLREKHPDGESALILGDCKFFVKDYPEDNIAALEKFKQDMNFKKIDTVDLSGKPSIVHDLQEPFDENRFDTYDWVIDAGTLFWCFDMVSVLANILNSLKSSGYIYHHASLTGHFGRGYHSLQPAFFKDFYEVNGFEVLDMSIRMPAPRTLLSKIVDGFYSCLAVDTKAPKRIDPKDVYLKTAGIRKLKFSDKLVLPEVSVMPVDSLISCFVHRKDKQAFQKPMRILNP